MSLLLQADARHIPLADGSVHCCVTSPPYWGLRDYKVEPAIWGGVAECKHAGDFSAEHGQFCRCGAWLGALGLEPTIDLYVAHIVEVFREVRRVLRKDGTLWLNMGDSYYGGNKGISGKIHPGDKQATNVGSWSTRSRDTGTLSPTRSGGAPDLKTKDLCMIPARLALALQADGAADPAHMETISRMIAAITASYDDRDQWPDRIRREVERLECEWIDAHRGGWWLRSDIIWAKPNPMPESVSDRPTKAHEYIFLLAKSERYFYDAAAIAEPSVSDHGSGNGFKGEGRLSYMDANGPRGSDEPWPRPAAGWHQGTRAEGAAPRDHRSHAPGRNSRIFKSRDPAHPEEWAGKHRNSDPQSAGRRLLQNEKRRRHDGAPHDQPWGLFRNARSVWTIPIERYSGAHFATFPAALAARCILAGCPKGGLVLDPFGGSGTVAATAFSLGRRFVHMDLKYHELTRKRIPPMAFVPGILAGDNHPRSVGAEEMEKEE